MRRGRRRYDHRGTQWHGPEPRPTATPHGMDAVKQQGRDTMERERLSHPADARPDPPPERSDAPGWRDRPERPDAPPPHGHADSAAGGCARTAGLSRLSAGLIDLLPAGVTVCDADGTIVEFNRRAAEFWGRVPAPGQTYCDFFAGQTLHHSDGRPM